MPNIQTYNAPVPDISVPVGGAEAHVQAGRVQHTFYDQAGAAVGGAVSKTGREIGTRIDDANAMHDIANGSLEMLQTEQALSREHDALLQASVAPDPDPNTSTPEQIDAVRQQRAEAQDKLDKFMTERAQPALQATADKWGKSDRSMAHMTGSMIEYSKGMMNKFAADRANVAGQQVISNLDSQRNAGVNGTLASPDMGELYHSQFLQTAKSMVDANPYLKPAERAKIMDHYTEVADKDFAEATVRGFMNKSTGKDPAGENAAKAILDSGHFDKMLDNKDQLYKEIESHKEHREAYADHKERQASQDAVDTLTSSIYDPKTGRVDYQLASQAVGKARTDPNVMERDRNKVGSFVAQAVRAQRAADEDEAAAVHDDPATVLGLMKGIQAGTTTLDDIGKAAVDKRITVARMAELSNSMTKPAADALKKALEDPVVKAQVGAGKLTIQGNTPGTALTGMTGPNRAVLQKQNQYEIDLYTKMRDAQMKGGDPRQFVDPKSPSYLDPQLYKPSQKELDDEMVLAPATAAAAAAPGAKPTKPPIGSFFKFGG